MSGGQLDRVSAWRALEGMRSGVPNRDAVRLLGTWQGHVAAVFDERLRESRALDESGRQARGVLISGGFGSGKSHLLEYLQHRALSANFMCSRLVISKEVPLHDPVRLFRAAAASALLPGATGEAIPELSQRLRSRPTGRSHLEAWLEGAGRGLSPIFAATATVHRRLGDDPDLLDLVTDFWCGEPIWVPVLRRALRDSGAELSGPLRTGGVRRLAAERFAFAAQLAVAAGLSGWVLLIDEVELIGRLGPLQRGRSYAELAGWMGAVRDQERPGMVVAAAITDDFDIHVLQEKGDLSSIGPRLRARPQEGMEELAHRAEAGMRLIRREAMALTAPTQETLVQAHDRLREIHSAAHAWSAPALEVGRPALRRAMRSHVRRWINEWDLRRLHPGAVLDAEEEELERSYALVGADAASEADDEGS